MSVRSFLDTNVLVYTDDQTSPEKRDAALDLIARCRRAGSGVLSTQVLQEYFVSVTRKLGVSPEVARSKLILFGKLHVVVPGVDDIVAAIDLHRLHGLSLWDALIVRAAVSSGCGRLYSEDLQPGRRFEGCEIVNPF